MPVGKKPTTAKQSASPRKTVGAIKGKDANKEFGGIKKVKIDESGKTSSTIGTAKNVALSKKNSV